MGSEAYGCQVEGVSDRDLWGWCIPPKEHVFPHLDGEILGFGSMKKRFEVWQEHHIDDVESQRQYDFCVYGVVRFFQLVMENNPNMLDLLFVPQRCVIICTQLAQTVRENRKMFLHKGLWHKVKGYAFSQLHKMETKSPDADSKRKAMVEKYGFDVKFGAHCVRLMLEAEQMLAEKDLDLERHGEQLKAIRRGEWPVERIKEFFGQKEKALEELYNKSDLPYRPDEAAIKTLLLKVLETHYGNLDKAIRETGVPERALQEIRSILDRTGY